MKPDNKYGGMTLSSLGKPYKKKRPPKMKPDQIFIKPKSKPKKKRK